MKAVLFDAAGVLTGPFSLELVRSALDAGADPEVLAEELYPLFASAGTGDSPGNRLERGELSLEEFLASLGDHEPHVRLVVDPDLPSFFGHFWEPDPVMQAFVAEVHDAGYATALVSNNVREWQHAWDRVLPPSLPFDVRLFSWQIGMRKPEPGMYQAALAELGVAAGDALFLDDFAAMAEGAREVGMTAIDVTDTADAIATAREILHLS